MARILVVEDEALIAVMLADWLVELGHQPITASVSIAQALMKVESENPDAAILDVNMHRERCDLVARVLTERSIPFALATGESAHSPDLPQGSLTVVTKPYVFESIRHVVEMLCGARAETPPAAAA